MISGQVVLILQLQVRDSGLRFFHFPYFRDLESLMVSTASVMLWRSFMWSNRMKLVSVVMIDVREYHCFITFHHTS